MILRILIVWLEILLVLWFIDAIRELPPPPED